MATLLLTILLLLVIVAAMAIGLMFGRPPIKGSCGGMSAMGAKGECAICGGDPGKCEEVSGSGGTAATGDTARDASTPADQVEGTVRRFDPRQSR